MKDATTTAQPTTKAGRRAARLAAWYATCQQLCTEYGAAPTLTGKKLSLALFNLEKSTYAQVLKYTAGKIDSEQMEEVREATNAAIYALLPGLASRTTTAHEDGEGSKPTEWSIRPRAALYLNSDPRGYALKLRPAEFHRLRALNIRLEMDGGNNGLLAPEINGDA